MTSAEEITSTIQLKKSELQKKYKFTSIALFGSFSRGENTADSDVDLMVEFNTPIGLDFVDLADELEQILGRKVDLVSKQAIKPKYLRTLESELIYV